MQKQVYKRYVSKLSGLFMLVLTQKLSARTWQDVKYPISQLFIPDSGGPVYGGGVTVDRVFRDMRCCISDWNDL